MTRLQGGGGGRREGVGSFSLDKSRSSRPTHVTQHSSLQHVCVWASKIKELTLKHREAWMRWNHHQLYVTLTNSSVLTVQTEKLLHLFYSPLFTLYSTKSHQSHLKALYEQGEKFIVVQKEPNNPPWEEEEMISTETFGRKWQINASDVTCWSSCQYLLILWQWLSQSLHSLRFRPGPSLFWDTDNISMTGTKLNLSCVFVLFLQGSKTHFNLLLLHILLIRNTCDKHSVEQKIL